MTVAVILAMYGVLIHYGQVSVMTTTSKRLFNTIMTGLSISLGLAVAMSIEKMCSEIQWWILTRRYRTRRKVELILRGGTLQHIVLLGIRSARITTRLSTLFAIILTLGSQIGLALIGLCYNTDKAENIALLSDEGKVAIANMSAIQTVHLLSSNSTSTLAQQYTANTYGTWSLAYSTESIDKIPKPGTTWDSTDPLYYCGDSNCQFIFHEASADSIDNDDLIPFYVNTQRSINSSAVCQSWAVTSGGSGTDSFITIENPSGNSSVFIPVQEGVDQTTYMTNTTLSCGPACSIVTAFEASTKSPWYYSCNVTVTNVTGGTRPEHEAGADLRAMAAAAIALKGYDMPSMANDTRFQYQVYPAESVFGLPKNGSRTDMAFLMARFAIGVVAIAAQNNPQLAVDGIIPTQGNVLKVEHWGYLHLIFFLTAGLQLVLGLTAAFVSHSVVVPRKGPIEVAKVMRAMMVPSSGTDRWIYKNRLVAEGGVYDAYMEELPGQAAEESDMIEMDQKNRDSGRSREQRL
ncbi:hypothetical protein GQ53DRAFT_743621 [Thozetella sp. PMI_491]|nr:hypothetical protein GQ53DRAFT_743621 [Thozetella sp. PMI_491]